MTRTSLNAKARQRLNEPQILELKRLCPDQVRFQVPMAALTTMGVGGPADIVVEPSSVEQLRSILDLCQDKGLPWLIVGRGSNLLAKDGGVRDVLIRIGERMAEFRVEDRGEWVRLRAQAGLPLRKLLREAVRNGWGGLGFLAGIPGTIGGAVAMNAGSYGRGIGVLVEEVTLVVPGRGIVRTLGENLSFGYRSVDLPHGAAIVEVTLRVPQVPSQDVVRDLRSHMIKRIETQPLGERSSGCIFKNPPGDFAGRLIEACGLKGLCLGRAMVSPKHANFIVNLGRASCKDVLGLMEVIQEKVRERTGVFLEPEVRVVGEDG